MIILCDNNETASLLVSVLSTALTAVGIRPVTIATPQGNKQVDFDDLVHTIKHSIQIMEQKPEEPLTPDPEKKD
jgi:hypothetical protein